MQTKTQTNGHHQKSRFIKSQFFAANLLIVTQCSKKTRATTTNIKPIFQNNLRHPSLWFHIEPGENQVKKEAALWRLKWWFSDGILPLRLAVLHHWITLPKFYSIDVKKTGNEKNLPVITIKADHASLTKDQIKYFTHFFSFDWIQLQSVLCVNTLQTQMRR